MSNMSYCRFQNTASDLKDCLDNLHTLDGRDQSYNQIAERNGRAEIIRMAVELLSELALDYPDDGDVEKAIDVLDAEEGVEGDDD